MQAGDQLEQLGHRAALDVKPLGVQVVGGNIGEHWLKAVELRLAGAEDLDPALVPLEQLPGARGHIALALGEAAQIDAERRQHLAVPLVEVGADRGDIAQLIRPDPHPHKRVRACAAKDSS